MRNSRLKLEFVVWVRIREFRLLADGNRGKQLEITKQRGIHGKAVEFSQQAGVEFRLYSALF